MEQETVEKKLVEIIKDGKFQCFKCGMLISGKDILGFDLDPIDDNPKVFYRCPISTCSNGENGIRKHGWRTLASLGIIEVKDKIFEDSPLLEEGVSVSEELLAQMRARCVFESPDSSIDVVGTVVEIDDDDEREEEDDEFDY